MAGTYAYTPAIWLPLTGAALVAVLLVYCWQRRQMPAVRPLLYAFALTIICLLAAALAAAATNPTAKLDWFRVRQAFLVPAATAGTCFVLEYAWPGRWLTRRNLALLGLPALLAVLLTVVNDAWFMAPTLVSGPAGQVQYVTGAGVVIFTAYFVLLSSINLAALLWLFVRSPQHRGPVAVMLLGQVLSRTLFLVDIVNQPWAPFFDPLVAGILISCSTYAVAAFGFRIFNPLSAARQAVFQQLPAAAVVFDARGRVLSLNPAAETILGISAASARGKTWHDLVPADELLAERLGASEPFLRDPATAGQPESLPDLALGDGADAREYARVLSPLSDFRGLVIGYLLVLPDMTDLHRAQAQALEQQRVRAIQDERERMARELHDSLGQVLSYTSLQAETAAQLALGGTG